MSRLSAKAGALLLLAAGGGLTLLAASSSWARLSAEDGLVGVSATVTGSGMAPLCVAAGVVSLAAVPAVLAVRRWLRAVVAVVVVALAVAALVQVAGSATDVGRAAREWWAVEVGALAETAVVVPTPWPFVAVVSLSLTVAGGALVLLRGRQWRGLSSRYDAPARSFGGRAQAGASGDADTWQALDRGEDPTEADEASP